MNDPLISFNNTLFFLIWCLNHIRCDQCGDLGAKVTLDKQFICTECARLLYST